MAVGEHGDSNDSARDKTVRYEGTPSVPGGQGAAEKYPCLVVLNGSTAGQTFRLQGQRLVVGRSVDADVVLSDPSVSRYHAEIVDEDGVLMLNDLGSTNGSFIDDERIYHHQLADGDRIRIGATIMLRFDHLDVIEERMQTQLYEGAVRDALTGVFNRKVFTEQLKREFAFAQRYDAKLSLVMIDVDNFKSINDRYGHPAGDAVLFAIAQRVQSLTRLEDFFARYGGEEFAALLRNADEVSARQFAERVRNCVVSSPIIVHQERKMGQALRPAEFTTIDPSSRITTLGGKTIQIPVTISAGVASLDKEKMSTVEELVQQADEALYRAKRDGRNRVST